MRVVILNIKLKNLKIRWFEVAGYFTLREWLVRNVTFGRQIRDYSLGED